MKQIHPARYCAVFAAIGLSVLLVQATANAAQWFVAPNGTSAGLGTAASPWNLATGLAAGQGGSTVRPGDTIWLRGGQYAGNYVSTLAGTSTAPIVVRQYPGERAILDRAGVSSAKQPALKVKGPHVWFWGFEVMNSHPDRSRYNPYSGDVEPWRGSGADVYASNVKFINMVFHDNGHGIWDKQSMTEVHGCLFYYNGNNKREHAMYIGNSSGTKFITDNVVFNQGGYGILGHSDSRSSSQIGLHIEGNAVFNNGMLTLDDQTTGNIQVGGVRGVPARAITIANNYVYNPVTNASSKNYGIRLGYEDKANLDVRLLGNYIVSKTPLRVWWWQSVQAERNIIYSSGKSVELKLASGRSTSRYQWRLNTYWSGRSSGPTFTMDGSSYRIPEWRAATGLDSTSQVMQNASLKPTGTWLLVRPNKYEAGRAHIMVYNWDLKPTVLFDLSNILPIGTRYRVRDAQNYFGVPVAEGIYDGSPIRLPMNLSQVTMPIGNVERVPAHTAPLFATFVLQPVL